MKGGRITASECLSLARATFRREAATDVVDIVSPQLHASQPHHSPATMKLSWGIVASSLYCAVAATKNGHVFTFDGTNNHAAPASSPIDPETARLILAQRLGLSRFHSIKHVDSEAIKSINTFGGRQQKLFGQQADTSKAQLLVWLEDAEESLVTSRHLRCVLDE